LSGNMTCIGKSEWEFPFTDFLSWDFPDYIAIRKIMPEAQLV